MNTITVTAAQMKLIEKEADANGLSYRQMMENAGTSAYRIIREHFPEADQLIIFAGKGNNGGDGCVVARLAAADGLKANLITCVGRPETTDAAYNYELLADTCGVEVMTFASLERVLLSGGGMQGDIFSKTTVIVDAIYGTGMKGEFRDSVVVQVCDLIDSAGCPVVALDLPSGVNADTGEAAKGTLHATLTITFHRMKPAHVNEDAKAYCGEVVVADIGIR